MQTKQLKDEFQVCRTTENYEFLQKLDSLYKELF